MDEYQIYSGTDVALIARRKCVEDMVIAINGETEFVYRGRAEDGKGIQELHLDFETAYYRFWVAFHRNGEVIVHRDCKDMYKRDKYKGYSAPHFSMMKSIMAVI